MSQLSYAPRPASEVYPGQFKILRRVNDNRRFNIGSKWAASGIISVVMVYSIFFHRWNDGYDNVFSDFYRFQLRCKWFFTGTLSKQDYDDLTPKQKGLNSAMVNETYDPDFEARETKFALQRPSRQHMIMAEKLAQQREEKYLRAVDMAEKQAALNKQNGDAELKEWRESETKKSWWGRG